MKKLLSLFATSVLLSVLATAQTITLTPDQRQQIAQGNKQTVLQVLRAAGVDATDSAAIAAAIQTIMADVTTQFNADADVVAEAAEAASNAAMDFAVDDGGATPAQAADVASAASSAVTKAVVQSAAGLNVSSVQLNAAVQSAAKGTILGTFAGSVGGRADVRTVAALVATGNVQGAAQGAANSGVVVASIAAAAGRGNDDGYARGDTAVKQGIDSVNREVVSQVTTNPPAPETNNTPEPEFTPTPTPEPELEIEINPVFTTVALSLSDGTFVLITVNDQTTAVTATIGSSAQGNSVLTVGSMSDFSLTQFANAAGLDAAALADRESNLQQALRSALSGRTVEVNVPDNVIIVSPSS